MFRKFFKWIIAPLLVIFIGFHALVIILLGVGSFVPVTQSSFMLAHRISGGEVTQVWVDYDAISTHAKSAAIASEDGKFTTHNGFDFESINAAIEANEAADGISMGGSTISQQLAKNLFLSSHRSYVRKAEEAIITMIMEQIWTKQRILEVYLNVVEFGEGIYGIEAASQHYFKKSAANLNREQAALLISMLPNPKYYGEHMDNRRLRNKQRIILRRMNGAILP